MASRKRLVYGFFLVLLIILVILASLLICAFTRYGNCNTASNLSSEINDGDIISPLDFFEVADALDIKWYHGTNTKSQLNEALDPKNGYMMLEADVILRFQGLPNQTDLPVMAHPPATDSDLTLDTWLDRVIADGCHGIKLDFKSVDAVAPALTRVAERSRKLRCPVWVNADTVAGPRGGAPINHNKFVQTINKTYPMVTVSAGWTTDCCKESFGMGVMETMWNQIKTLQQPVSISARAALLRNSWPEFRWILEKSQKNSLTVWTPAGSLDWEGADIYDLLYVRNDWFKERIYYDLPGKRFEEFKTLVKTAGSALHHFDIKDRDAAKVTWGHAINSKSDLEKNIKDDVMFLEADILLKGQDTDRQTNVPIMAHPPSISSDITFAEWVDRVAETRKGMKLDFKSIQAVAPALRILKEKYQQGKLTQPIWLNADILTGPNTNAPGRNASEFLKVIDETFPQCTLSIGWTTGWSNTDSDAGYSMEMVQEMHELARNVRQPVNFPIRAAAAKRSWEALDWLLKQSRGYTLTVWHATADVVSSEDVKFVRDHSEHSRVYFDLPQTLMPV